MSKKIHEWFCSACGTKWDQWMVFCPIHGIKLKWFDYPETFVGTPERLRE